MDKKHFSILFKLKQKYGTIYPIEIKDELYVCRQPTLKEIDSFISVALVLNLNSYEQEIEFAKILQIAGEYNEEALSELGSKIIESFLLNDNYKEYEQKAIDKFKYGYYKELKTTNYLNLTDEQIDNLTSDDLLLLTKRLIKDKNNKEQPPDSPPKDKDPYAFNFPNVKIV